MAELLNFKIFDLYDISGISVKDPALKPYDNLSQKLILKSQGRRKDKLVKVMGSILLH